MRTLVTGGAGFVGSHLVRRLLELGDEVVVLDSLDEQVHTTAPVPPDGARFVKGDVGDRAAAADALRGVDRVVHLAAAVGVGQSMYEIARYVDQNTLSTAVFLECLLQATPRPARLVVASSMSIYGEGEYVCATHGHRSPGPRAETQLLSREWEVVCPDCEQPVEPIGTSESKPLLPTSVYAVTKRDHEELCLSVGAAYGIPAVALRFFNIYGPGQALSNPYTGVAAIFASRLLNDRPALVFEDGQQSRDFIHVTDICEGIVRALESEEAVGLAINLGVGRPVTVLDVGTALAQGLGKEIAPEVTGKYRAGDIRHCFADVSRAEKVLGFRAAVTLNAGMAHLIEWLRDQSAVDHVDHATSQLVALGLAR
jgi:dTDP-L-rhamnose 4-epimerase